MAIYSNTRIVLRHLTARLMNDLITGTVVSPGSGTFVCAETPWEVADDYFNKYLEVFCYAGTGVGTSGNPTDWVNSTHTLTFLPAATLTAGDSVEMHLLYRVGEYNDAINLAIDMAARDALLHKVDESITLDDDTYQYTLPTQFLWVHSIQMESSTSGVYDSETPIDPRYWRILKAATLELEFVKNLWSPTDGRVLRIDGLASPSKLDIDTEACPIDPFYVVQQAAAILHQSRIRGADDESKFHTTQMAICQKLADTQLARMRVSVGGARPVVEV